MEAIVDFKDNMAVVIHSDDYTGTVTIPDYDGNGRPITGITEGAFLNCKKVTEIRLGRNIDFVGDSAFEGCENLGTIILNERVRSIGKFAFFNCKSLTSIELNHGVGKIGRSAFQNCEALKDITLHYGVSEIAPWTFAGCKQLKSVDIPNGVKHIGHQAFAECVMLEKIETLSSNTTLGYEVFLRVNPKCVITVPLYCDEEYKSQGQWNNFNIRVNDERIFSFNGIKYKEKESNILLVAKNESFYGHAKLDAEINFMGRNLVVEEIEEQAFARNDRLASVYIPASIERIGTGAFAACAKLQYFTTDNMVNCKFEAKNGVLFSKSGDTLIAYPAANDKSAFSIPATVAKIADYAFSSFQSLERITFCNKEIKIGENVFLEAAVGNCCAFVPKEADKLKKKLSSIGFKEIVDSNKITVGRINYKILTGIEDGNAVEVAENPSCVGKIEIPERIEYAGVKYTVVGVGVQAFCLNKNIDSIRLPRTIIEIKPQAFDSSSVSHIEIPPYTEKIGWQAFHQTTKAMNEITIPSSVNEIGHAAFNKSNFKSLKVDSRNQHYCAVDNVLYDKQKTRLIYYMAVKPSCDFFNVPEGVEIIGKTSLQEARITHLHLPASLKAFDSVPFWYNQYIKTISIEAATPPTVKEPDVFSHMAPDCFVIVPNGCVSIYRSAEGWKQFKKIVSVPNRSHFVVIEILGQKEHDIFEYLWELEKDHVIITVEKYKKKMCFWVKYLDFCKAQKVSSELKKLGAVTVIRGVEP